MTTRSEQTPDAEQARMLTCLRERLLEAPSDTEALARAGELLSDMGRFSEAAAHFDKAILCSGCPVGKPAKGTANSASARNRTAGDSAERHYGVLAALADCYLAVNDHGKAEMYWRAASALSPGRARPHVCMGALAMERGLAEQAAQCFEAARAAEPDCGEAYIGLAMIHQEQGRYTQALEMYLRCLEHDGDNLVALLGLFQASCQMGTFSKIIHYLEVYLRQHPDDTSVQFCLATLYAREGRLCEARQAVSKVLDLQPQKQEASKLLAEIEEALAGASGVRGTAR